MIEAYPRDQKPDLVEESTLPVEEISTEDAWEALQTQIFRVSGGIFLNESYLIRGFEVIQLGTALGGYSPTCNMVPLAVTLFSVAALKGVRTRASATISGVLSGMIVFMAVGNPLFSFPWSGCV